MELSLAFTNPPRTNASPRLNSSVDIPSELAPFVERLIAERRFLTESEVLAEGLRLLQSQETLRAAVGQGFAQLDEGKSAAADTVFAKAEERIASIERAGRA